HRLAGVPARAVRGRGRRGSHRGAGARVATPAPLTTSPVLASEKSRIGGVRDAKTHEGWARGVTVRFVPWRRPELLKNCELRSPSSSPRAGTPWCRRRV